MKKLLIAGMTALSLSMGLSACAETTSGKVIKTDGNTITIRDTNGMEHTMKTNENTTYRKKMSRRHATSDHSKHKASQKPIFVEDDYVEVIYFPDDNSEWIIEDAVIYEE